MTIKIRTYFAISSEPFGICNFFVLRAVLFAYTTVLKTLETKALVNYILSFRLLRPRRRRIIVIMNGLYLVLQTQPMKIRYSVINMPSYEC